MDIVFTNEFKNYHISTNNGINFTLKGYALYYGDLGNSLEDVTYNNFENLKLYNITYIPTLEATVATDENDIKLGTYEIPMNKSIYTEEFIEAEQKYVLLIGIDLNESNRNDEDGNYRRLYTDTKESSDYLAAIIPIEDFDANKSLKYYLDVSICSNEVVNDYGITYDSNFTSFKGPSTMLNLNTIQFRNYLSLIPDNYLPDDINNRMYLKGNLVLLDDSPKISNNWNKKPKLFIGVNRDCEVNVPHIKLTDLYEFAVDFTYNPDEQYFGINPDKGLLNFISDTISYNNNNNYSTNILNLKSNYNTIGSNYSLLVNSNSNTINESDYVTTLNSNGNYIQVPKSDYFGAGLILNSHRSRFNSINHSTIINTIDSNIDFDNSPKFSRTTIINANNILSSTNGVEANSLNTINITFIGNNRYSTITPISPDVSTVPLTNKVLIGFSGLTVTNNNTNSVVFGNYNADINTSDATFNDLDIGQPIFVVADGKPYTTANVTGHTPDEFALKETTYSNDCIRLNLFSVEKNSWQLVHNDSSDLNEAEMQEIPGMFAIRKNEPITQEYFTNVSGEFEQTKYKYNLQNAIYTTSSILIPLRRSSNDVYQLPLTELYKLSKGEYKNSQNNKTYNFSNLKTKLNSLSPNTISIKCSNFTTEKISLDYIIGKYNSYFTDPGAKIIYLTNDLHKSITFVDPDLNEYSIPSGKTKKIVFNDNIIYYIKN